MSVFDVLKYEFAQLFSIKRNNRKLIIPLLAATCVGVPLLIGWFFENLRYGLFACISGLVILYLPHQGSRSSRIMTLLVCAFGFMISYAYGLTFSFHPVAAVIAFGLFTFVVHLIILYYKTSPPKSFFFILLASIAICSPFDLAQIPTKVGLIGLGTIFTCLLALIYLFSIKISPDAWEVLRIPSLSQVRKFANYWESIIMSTFMTVSLGIGLGFGMDNPYWIPISCAAVMQGASRYDIWQRSIQRIIGTFVGLGFCWVILSFIQTPLAICLTIIVLQFIIELFVTRQYALAVIFITPLTILLAEAGNSLMADPNHLINLRFWEIVIGSLLGALGGWILHKEKIRYHSIRGMIKLGGGPISRKH